MLRKRVTFLDIVLVNEPNTVFTVDVNAPLGSSDHCRVDFTIVIELELSDGMADVSAKQLPMNKHYCWRDADYEGIANFLANYDWTQLFSLNPSVNEMWTAFSDVMHCATDMYVPAISNGKRLKPVNGVTLKKYVKRLYVSGAYGVSIVLTV